MKHLISLKDYSKKEILDFIKLAQKIKKISKILDLNIGYTTTKENYETLYFCGLRTYLNFYNNYIWHPRKLDRATSFLKKRDPFVLLNHNFFKTLTEKKVELSRLFHTELRTIYRYFDQETFIPFSKLVSFCKNKQLNQKNLIDQIKKVRTSREIYRSALAKDIYKDFLKINGLFYETST